MTPTVGATDYVNLLVRDAPISKGFDFPDLAVRKDGPPVTILYPPQAAQPAHILDIQRDDFLAVQERIRREETRSATTPQSTPGRYAYFYGWVRYRDVFEDTTPHVTMFCYEVTGIRTVPPTAATPPPTNLALTLSLCAEHNCTDKQCEVHQ